MDPKDKNAESEKERQETNFATRDAARMLEGISRPQENPPYTINVPAPTESQSPQAPSSGRPSGGGINRGINTINNLARRGFPNPLGKIGSRIVAQTALRGFAAFLAGPGLPIVIAIVSVFVFTLIMVVGFGGGVPSIAPAETPTPTPAVP